MTTTRNAQRRAAGLAIQSIPEEIANSIVHGIGAGLSIAGLCVLVVLACRRGTAWHVVASAIFGGALVNLYLISTLYHSLPGNRAKKVFRRLDHISIYILIAGTYTPFTLIFLRGALGWTLFGLEWGLALAGILFKAIWGPRYDFIATLGYVFMGWLIVIAAWPMLKGFPVPGLLWLLAGGLACSGGVLFYFKDEKVPFFHAVWHLFILGGTICFFFTVLLYLIPPR